MQKLKSLFKITLLTSFMTATSIAGIPVWTFEPRFMVFNADESLAYITARDSNLVYKCQVEGNGNLNPCSPTGSNMQGPVGIHLVKQ